MTTMSPSQNMKSLTKRENYNQTNTNFSHGSRKFNSRKEHRRRLNRSVIPTMINLKEIREMHGKTFAKFRLKFKNPNQNLALNNPRFGKITMPTGFKWEHSNFKRLNSPANQELVAAGMFEI